jgi:hypothetical protein
VGIKEYFFNDFESKMIIKLLFFRTPFSSKKKLVALALILIYLSNFLFVIPSASYIVSVFAGVLFGALGGVIIIIIGNAYFLNMIMLMPMMWGQSIFIYVALILGEIISTFFCGLFSTLTRKKGPFDTRIAIGGIVGALFYYPIVLYSFYYYYTLFYPSMISYFYQNILLTANPIHALVAIPIISMILPKLRGWTSAGPSVQPVFKESKVVTITYTSAKGESKKQRIKMDLNHFNLSNKNIAAISLTELAEHKSVTTINLSNNRISSIDLEPLAALRDLKEIRLEKNALTELDFTPLSDCRNLQIISISDNPLADYPDLDFTPISECRELRELDIAGIGLDNFDLSPLSNCQSFRLLRLDRNNLTNLDLSPLEDCRVLEHLSISENPLQSLDLTPLRKCLVLETVNLKGCDLDWLDISPLFECRRLTNFMLDKSVEIKIDRQLFDKKDVPAAMMPILIDIKENPWLYDDHPAEHERGDYHDIHQWVLNEIERGNQLFESGSFDEASTVYANIEGHVQQQSANLQKLGLEEYQTLLSNVSKKSTHARAEVALSAVQAAYDKINDFRTEGISSSSEAIKLLGQYKNDFKRAVSNLRKISGVKSITSVIAKADQLERLAEQAVRNAHGRIMKIRS